MPQMKDLAVKYGGRESRDGKMGNTEAITLADSVTACAVHDIEHGLVTEETAHVACEDGRDTVTSAAIE